MSLETTVTCFWVVLVATVAGAAFDTLIRREGADRWQNSLVGVWDRLHARDMAGAFVELNSVFVEYFDCIYGNQMWSKRRLLASILTSMIGIMVLTVLLAGVDNYWYSSVRHNPVSQSDSVVWFFASIAFVLSWPVLINVPADFISLIETRFVLTKIRNKAGSVVVLFVLLDLILTFLVFWVFASIAEGLDAMFYEAFNTSSDERDAGEILGLIGIKLWGTFSLPYTDPAEAWERISNLTGYMIFFLTTFVTSIIWILFVVAYFAIWVVDRVSGYADLVVYEFSVTRSPGLSVGVMAGFVIVLGILSLAAIWQMIALT